MMSILQVIHDLNHFYQMLLRALIFLLVTTSSFAIEMPWRSEPYALLLVQQATKTQRPLEKREYLKRIFQRLHIQQSVDTWNEKQLEEALRHLRTLFFATTNDTETKEAFSYLQPLFGTIPKNPIIDHDPSLEWTKLQLYALSLDMKPLTLSLSSLEEKIESINWYLFFLGEIRYPPLSNATKRVDYYSSIGPILSSRQGICLGTTILFAAVCQEMDIPVQIYTPPGHIFPAVPINGVPRTVETTARGAKIPLLYYESLDQPTLEPKGLDTLKISYLENKAATALTNHEFEKARDLYLSCPENHQMLAITSLLLNRPREASREAKKALQEEEKDDLLLTDIAASTIPSKAFQTLFDIMIDESDLHLEEHSTKLQNLSMDLPKSNAIRYYGAIVFLKLHRLKEAEMLLTARTAPTSLNWWLLKVSLAQELQNKKEELKNTIVLLKRAIEAQKIPYSLIELCRQVLHQNPDCKELSSLLQKVLSNT